MLWQTGARTHVPSTLEADRALIELAAAGLLVL